MSARTYDPQLQKQRLALSCSSTLSLPGPKMEEKNIGDAVEQLWNSGKQAGTPSGVPSPDGAFIRAPRRHRRLEDDCPSPTNISSHSNAELDFGETFDFRGAVSNREREDDRKF